LKRYQTLARRYRDPRECPITFSGRFTYTTMAEDTQVVCRFVTRMPEEFRITETPFAVPARLSRYGLSEVVNHLLNLETPKPLDFIVEGQLVRGSLEKVILAKNISAETTVTVEYIPAVSPPSPEAQGEHNDWISSVDSTHSKYIVSGSYDGLARVWTADGKCKAELSGHTDSVTAVAVVPDLTSKHLMVLTASKDCTARLWEVTTAGTAHARTVAVFGGHPDSIDTIAAAPSASSMCATAGWDGIIRLWSWRDTAGGEETVKAASKKLKTGTGEREAAAAGPVEGRVVTELEGHQGGGGCVAEVCWPTQEELYSASWDRSVRKWDTESGKCLQTFNSSKAVYSVAAAPQGGALVALSGAEKAVRLWDPRVKESSAAAAVLLSHAGWVSCVRWVPHSPHHLWSAGHDNKVKLWDIRGKVPLHTISAHTNKVLCVDTHAGKHVVSGGADCKLHWHSMDLA